MSSSVFSLVHDKSHVRPSRGRLSRLAGREVLAYRRQVDDAVGDLMAMTGGSKFGDLVTLCLNDEQPHQEFLLTDVKQVFSCNPLEPASNPELEAPPSTEAPTLGFVDGTSGIREIGADGNLLFHQRDAAPSYPVASAQDGFATGDERWVS